MRAHIPLLVAAGLATSFSLAGPLTPPAGPVAPSLKTLPEVEPRTVINATNTPGDANTQYKISQPGSYYLTGNIDGVPGKAAIAINCSQATIDLNGFKITGGGDGIQIYYNCIFTIKNGLITGCSGAGINCYNQYARGTIEDVTATYCAGDGFFLGIGETLRRCVSRHNGQSGFIGSIHMVYEDCTASDNTTNGFYISSSSRAIGCMAERNGSNGFQSGASTKLRGCRATNNFTNGFQVSEATLEDCVAVYNAHTGFDIGSSSTLTNCTSQHNSQQGLHGMSRNTVTSSVFTNHGAGFSGLWLEAANNFVEDSEFSSNGFGVFFDATATQNIVVSSRANNNANTNFAIPSGNQSAPVITNPAANGFATTTPWSNIAY
jgi:hypothetical protein